jgi:hypothetical protein
MADRGSKALAQQFDRTQLSGATQMSRIRAMSSFHFGRRFD